MNLDHDSDLAAAVRREIENLGGDVLGHAHLYDTIKSKIEALKQIIAQVENQDLRLSLLLELTSFLVVAAHLVGNLHDVIAFSGEYLERRRQDGGYVNVVFPRLSALHYVERHGDELETWSDAIRSSYMTGADKIRLLDHVGQRHPEQLHHEKVAEILKAFHDSDLFQELDNVDPELPRDVVTVAAHVTALSLAITRWNRFQAQRVLNDEQQ